LLVLFPPKGENSGVDLFSMNKLARRQFLWSSARLLGAAAMAGTRLPALAGGLRSSAADWLAFPQQPEAYPGKEKLIVRSLKYLDLEMPAYLIDSWITPAELFYVRTHLPTPTGVNLAEWRLRVIGEVERPLTLTLSDLQSMTQKSVVTVMECAGNGRSFFRPRVPGIQWGRGAVGNGQFAGPLLSEILRKAGVKATGKHVAFKGFDTPPGKVPEFIRSIPIDKAMHSDTIVALQMDGAALRIEHGFPARIVPPGWVGAAFVKWVEEIRVIGEEFNGNFMRPGYRFPNRPVEPGGEIGPDETTAITAMPVKSIIGQPVNNWRMKKQPLRIFGAAWAGENDIARVDVSTDEGKTWHAAKLGADHARYAWRLWEYNWTPPQPGAYVLMSRATDTAGRTQPAQPSWNPSGYLWNVIDQVRVYVQA
jgi:sulfite oxidase